MNRAEIFSNGENNTFQKRWAEYQKECALEISNIIKKNPIKFEEVNIGEKLTLYTPLKGLSKIRFDNLGEFTPIKELFRAEAHYYCIGMWSLAWMNEFTVYDKRETSNNLEKKTSQIRIERPIEKNDIFSKWINLKYFEKI
jgi:hypothetical protein